MRVLQGYVKPKAINVEAPDGMICEVVRAASRRFSPIRWKGLENGKTYVPKAPSAGLKAHRFSSARGAMMAAYRERLQQEEALRSAHE